MNARQHIIEMQGVTIRFGNFTAVDDVSFDVERGAVVGLLGPNGSGKTTLMRAACGLLPLAAGTMRIFGVRTDERGHQLRQKIGYMAQRFSIYEDLTVQENIDFYGGIYGLSRRQKKATQAELVALTKLGPYLKRRAQQLSGGWRQRLALVCAMLHGPQLMFLDEPTAGIDPVARRELWDLLFDIAGQGVTLVVSTHYMDEAQRCERIAYLHLSRLLAMSRPQELCAGHQINLRGRRRVEIDAADLATTLARLRRSPAVHEATILGQQIRAVIAEDACLADLGLKEAQVRPTLANLEDALLALAASAHPQRDDPRDHSGLVPGLPQRREAVAHAS